MPDNAAWDVAPVRDRRPLSVQVYDRLVNALKQNSEPGALVPPETELSARLGVSRTVLREALRLLEEDGVIERASDPRRRRLASPSTRPAEFTASLEEMLHIAAPYEIRVVRTERLAPTQWSSSLLQLPEDAARLLCRETLIVSGGEPVASALELVPALDGALGQHIAAVEQSSDQTTLLNALGPQFRSSCTPILWRVGAGTSRRLRSGFHDVPEGTLTALTTVLSRHGRPVFLAKYLLRLDLVSISVGNADPEIEDILT